VSIPLVTVVAVPVLHVVGSKVLASGNNLLVLGVVAALKTVNQSVDV